MKNKENPFFIIIFNNFDNYIFISFKSLPRIKKIYKEITIYNKFFIYILNHHFNSLNIPKTNEIK